MIVNKPQRFGTVVVPLDFSETSLSALKQARDIAGPEDHIVVCHIVDDVPLTWGYVGLAVPAAEIRSKASKQAQQNLEQLLHSAELNDAQVKLCHGSPSQEILRVAEEEHAGLIVMGTHGRSGIDHALMGSVTEKVIRRAPCPVLVMRAHSEREAN